MEITEVSIGIVDFRLTCICIQSYVEMRHEHVNIPAWVIFSSALLCFLAMTTTTPMIPLYFYVFCFPCLVFTVCFHCLDWDALQQKLYTVHSIKTHRGCFLLQIFTLVVGEIQPYILYLWNKVFRDSYLNFNQVFLPARQLGRFHTFMSFPQKSFKLEYASAFLWEILAAILPRHIWTRNIPLGKHIFCQKRIILLSLLSNDRPTWGETGAVRSQSS